MPIDQFHRGSPRRKIESKMLAKILVLSVALATTNCQEYHQKAQHEPQEYTHYIKHVPVSLHSQHSAPVYEAQSAEVQGDGYEQGLSQNLIQYTHGQQASEDSQEHYRPVYHYVQAGQESPSQHYTAPIQQEIQTAHGHAQLSHEEYSHHHQPAHEPARHYAHQDQSHEAPHENKQSENNSHDSHEKPIDYYAYPKYQYEYKVEDPHTGDNKYQHEVRDGDVVKGVYSFHEADGSIRTVEYSSDKHTGFTAVVKHSAPSQHVEYRSHQKH